MSNWWDSGQTKSPRTDMSKYPAGVRQWEVDKGGWRYDENNNSYFLSWEELLEFEEKNATTPDDNEFNRWFRDDFRKKHNITPRSGATHRSATVKTTYADDDWDTIYEKPKKGWLSSWWADDVYKGWSVISGKGAHKDQAKLAIALQAVKSVVRVVDDTLPPMAVTWAADSNSFTDFKNKIIVVNPKPITDGKVADGEAIDITTGFALHEASHSQYSREPYETLQKPTELSPMQVAGVLLNIVDDVRIERKTGEVFPGFTGYFDAALRWVWEETKEHAPKAYGPDLGSKINSVVSICRWPEESKTIMTDPTFLPEIPWWTNWRDEYLSGAVDARTTVERGLEHLREPNENEKAEGKDSSNSQAGQEMDEMAKEEEALRKAIGEAKRFVDEMIKKGLDKLAKGRVCAAHDKQEGIGEEAARSVSELVEQELRQEKPTVPAPAGMRTPFVTITRPKEDASSKRRYIGKPAPILQKLKAALVFRQELPRWHERLMKEGLIDDDELWRFGAKDYRVFGEEHITGRPKVQLGLLVDMSGSMTYGRKLETAQELAQLMVMAAKEMDGVHVRVHGHTGDLGVEGSDVFRIWEEGDPITRLGLISSLDHANNYDGFAIEYCAKDLMRVGDADEQRVLIVLSDGYPAGSGYGGQSAERHMRAVGEWAEKKGVTVIQIAIDEAVRPDAQARMFKHWVQFTSMQDLPRKLMKLLERIV